MRIQDSVWQGSFGYWQNLFIQQNILAIGYTAWKGFLNVGRGILVCHVETPINGSVNWSLDHVQYDLQFVSQLQASAYFESLKLDQTAVSNILQIIATYDPQEAIVFLVSGNGQIDINLLQHLAIAPAECYDQVGNRWAEFQPCLTS